MSDDWPFVSVIIAARPGQADLQAVTAARGLDYPRDRLEILVARGAQPSVQRNRAVKEARGELIYFLDDDSEAAPENLHLAVPHFRDPKVQVVGGPNLCPDDAPPLEQAFAGAMGNTLAFGPSAARYRPVGATRDSSEKELILCNMLMRRDGFLQAGGFDEALYPNEENALMDALQKAGGRLVYDPALIVRRRPRSNLRSFIKMLMNYGRGRAEQFRLHPGLGSVLNFVPPLFCLYLVLVLTPWLPRWLLAPLALYAVVVAGSVVTSPKPPGANPLAVAGCVVLTHLFYGFGFWRGLFTRLSAGPERPPVNVTLEKVAIG